MQWADCNASDRSIEGPERDEDDEDDEDDIKESSWLKPASGDIVLHGTSAKVAAGYCQAQTINRLAISRDFYNEMEEALHHLSELTYTLFDRYGHLKPEHKKHPIKKGTGVWGKELDIGRILFFDDLQIIKQYRRQGFACKLILAMLDKPKSSIVDSSSLLLQDD
jgi:hypothetical protein